MKLFLFGPLTLCALVRHSNNFFGDLVGFFLVFVACRPYGQLGLDGSPSNFLNPLYYTLHISVAVRFLQLAHDADALGDVGRKGKVFVAKNGYVMVEAGLTQARLSAVLNSLVWRLVMLGR
ncbi:MAG: hypothetical protein J4N99_09100 [Chloroflexi bacterium]|nr:hypothetical protein [Chloroflexota bacterium]